MLELAVIVLGVLIALFVDGLKEDYQDRKLGQVTLKSFEKEFRANAREVQRTQAGLQRLLDSLEAYTSVDSLSPAEVMIKASGALSLPDLSTTTWQTALQANALHKLDFALIYQLTIIQRQH